jgi:hypothetical protein
VVTTMHDPHLRKRSALVVLGTLAAFYGVLAIVYFEGLRTDDVPCGDGGQVRGEEVCYHAWKPLALAAVAGAGLAAAAFVAWPLPPASPETLARPGTGTHTVFALLASLVALPLVGLAAVFVAEASRDTRYLVDVAGDTYRLAEGLGALALVGLLPFAAFAGMLLLQARNRRRLEEFERQQRGLIHPVEAGRPAPIRAMPVRDVSGAPAVFVDEGHRKP